MCTAVVGGSIHRAASRINAASSQASTAAMTSHRKQERRSPVRSEVLICEFGIVIRFGNNSPERVGDAVELSLGIITMWSTAILFGRSHSWKVCRGECVVGMLN